MTFARGFQIGFEIRQAQEFATIRNENLPDGTGASGAHTGDYGIDHDGPLTGIGWGFPLAASVRGSFWMNHGGALTESYLIIVPGDSDVWPAHVIYDPDTGLLELYVDEVLQDSASSAAVGLERYGAWLNIGIAIKKGVSGWVTVYLDGVEILGYDAGPTDDMDGFYVCENDSTGWVDPLYVDDIYADYGDGTESEAVPAGYRFLWSTVDAAGTNADWTSTEANNYQAVDDAVPDGDTTTNHAASTGLIDSFDHVGITVPDNYSISAAIPVALARKGDTVDETVKLIAYDGATTKKSSSGIFVPMDYDPVFDRFTTDADGDAWTESEFNSTEFGYESVI